MNLDEANALRWRPGLRDYYEVYYLTLNDTGSEIGCWIRYLVHAPASPSPPSTELWFTFFDRTEPKRCFGLFESRSIEQLTVEERPFRIRLGDAELRSGHCHGALSGHGHRAHWDLHFESLRDLILPFPEQLYSSGEVPGAMLYPYPAASFVGELEVDTRRMRLAGALGEQSHIWGRKHPPHWLWAHCNHFDGDAGGYLEVSYIPAAAGASDSEPRHVALVRWRNDEARLISPLDASVAVSESAPGHWTFRAESERERIDLELSCPLSLIAEAPYVDPDSSRCFCLHTDLAECTVAVRRRGPGGTWSLAAELYSPGCCHAEWGDRHRHPDVATRVQEIAVA